VGIVKTDSKENKLLYYHIGDGILKEFRHGVIEHYDQGKLTGTTPVENPKLKSYTYKDFNECSFPQGNETIKLYGKFEIPIEYHEAFSYLKGDKQLKIISLHISHDTPDPPIDTFTDKSIYYRFYLKEPIFIGLNDLIQEEKNHTKLTPKIAPTTNTGQYYPKDIKLEIDDEKNKIKIKVDDVVRDDLTNMGNLCGKTKDMDVLLKLLGNGEITRNEYKSQFTGRDLAQHLKAVNKRMRKVLDISLDSKPLQQVNKGVHSNFKIKIIKDKDVWDDTSTGLNNDYSTI